MSWSQNVMFFTIQSSLLILFSYLISPVHLTLQDVEVQLPGSQYRHLTVLLTVLYTLSALCVTLTAMLTLPTAMLTPMMWSVCQLACQ